MATARMVLSLSKGVPPPSKVKSESAKPSGLQRPAAAQGRPLARLLQLGGDDRGTPDDAALPPAKFETPSRDEVWPPMKLAVVIGRRLWVAAAVVLTPKRAVGFGLKHDVAADGPLCYRRGSDAGFAQALYQQLENEFAGNLFMDVEGQISSSEYTMFRDLQRRHHWVLTTHRYDSQMQLIADFGEKVIRPSELKVQDLRGGVGRS